VYRVRPTYPVHRSARVRRQCLAVVHAVVRVRRPVNVIPADLVVSRVGRLVCRRVVRVNRSVFSQARRRVALHRSA